MFIGRQNELNELLKLKQKETASLVCLLGRRRIGKSSLVEKFGTHFKKFLSFQGLGPEVKSHLYEQLAHFTFQFNQQTNQRQKTFESWAEAFEILAQTVSKGEYLILLDEISWMARGDDLFAAKLKDIWDRKLKKNHRVILVLCGSVSAWIQDNILNNANFEGRVSLRIDLPELDLPSINHFWTDKNYRMGSLEKAMILSVTGGVPKYLEEVVTSETASTNLVRLCFSKSGLLFNDYHYIFNEVLGRRAALLERIIKVCLEKKLAPIELTKTLKVDYNSDFSKAIEILELSGFLSRDFYFKPDGTTSKLSHLRVKDNYLRFYLKYIEPNRLRILKGGKIYSSITDLKNYESLLGLQFENLILQNRNLIFPYLALTPRQVISAAPYKQNKTTVNKGSCQIDLLIHSELDIFFLCEIKCKKSIDHSVIKEVKVKADRLRLPRRSSLKPVLIYEGELYPPHEQDLRDYFFQMISFSELINTKS